MINNYYSIYQFIPFFNSSILPFIFLFFYASTFASKSIQPPILCPSVHDNPPIHTIHPVIHPSIDQFVPPSIHPLEFLAVRVVVQSPSTIDLSNSFTGIPLPTSATLTAFPLSPSVRPSVPLSLPPPLSVCPSVPHSQLLHFLLFFFTGLPSSVCLPISCLSLSWSLFLSLLLCLSRVLCPSLPSLSLSPSPALSAFIYILPYPSICLSTSFSVSVSDCLCISAVVGHSSLLGSVHQVTRRWSKPLIKGDVCAELIRLRQLDYA